MGSSDYGDACAEFYDDLYGAPRRDVVRTLGRLAAGGSVLELGLATGRTALALRPHCAEVVGIESSRAMLERFRSKPESRAVRAVEGDFATLRLGERFDLVFALVNTLFLLETEARQLACLRNVSSMLEARGRFVVESYRPSEDCDAGVRTYCHDVETRGGRRRYVARMLYRDAGELDALAARAGLALSERWSDWRGAPYGSGDDRHVSVYVRVAETPLYS